MSGLSTPLIALAFALAAGATWIAGIGLSRTTDELDHRLGLGEARPGSAPGASTGAVIEGWTWP